MAVASCGAPDFTISGDVEAIRLRIAVMRDRVSDFDTIAQTLETVAVDGWTGRAADRFREHFEIQPARWRTATAQFTRAADAWDSYVQTLEIAQGDAAQAKIDYESGVQMVEAALEQQRLASLQPPPVDRFGFTIWFDDTPHPERDTGPGEQMKADAVAAFDAAVASVNAEGEVLAQVLYDAAAQSPDPAWAPVHFGRRVVVGVFTGLWDMLSLSYGAGLEAMWDYGRYFLGHVTWDELNAKHKLKGEDVVALWEAAKADPAGFVAQMLAAAANVDGWADDPGAALGQLIPDVVVGAMTAGAGTASGQVSRGARVAGALESLPLIGETVLMRDIMAGSARRLPRIADNAADGAQRAGSGLSPRLQQYLEDHGLGHLVEKWKARHPSVHSSPDPAQSRHGADSDAPSPDAHPASRGDGGQHRPDTDSGTDTPDSHDGRADASHEGAHRGADEEYRASSGGDEADTKEDVRHAASDGDSSLRDGERVSESGGGRHPSGEEDAARSADGDGADQRGQVDEAPEQGEADADRPAPPKDGHDVAAGVPKNEFQAQAGDPPSEGLAKGIDGADLVRDPSRVLGVHEDGTPYTYQEWLDENRYWGYNARKDKWEWMVKWPPDDGYDEAGRVFYSSVGEFVSDHGSDLDRIGHPSGGYLGVVENGVPASFEERSLNPQSLHDHYYRYEFASDAQLPDGWRIETGRAAAWGQQPGGARQLRIIKGDGTPASVQEMLDYNIIRGR